MGFSTQFPAKRKGQGIQHPKKGFDKFLGVFTNANKHAARYARKRRQSQIAGFLKGDPKRRQTRTDTSKYAQTQADAKSKNYFAHPLFQMFLNLWLPNLWFAGRSPKTTEITKKTETTKTTQTATNEELSAGLAEITESTAIQGANHRFPNHHPVVALNPSSKSQIAARYAAFWHAVPQIALTAFLCAPKSQRFKSQRLQDANATKSQTLAFDESQCFSATQV